MLVITREDVERLLRPEAMVEAAEKALRCLSEGRVTMPPRATITPPGGWWGFMPAFIEPEGALAIKVVSAYPENPKRGLPNIQAAVLALSPEDGRILALIEGASLTAHRTAAASALSAKYTVGSAGSVGIIGAGVQGRYHAWYLAATLGADTVYAFDIVPSKVDELARFLEAKGAGIRVVRCGSAAEVCRKAEVVAAATTAKAPVISGAELRRGAHVISIGAHTPDAREVDDEVLRRAEHILVDHREACLRETGDIIGPVRSGLISPDQLVELGEVAAGRRRVGRAERGITFYKSVGVAVLDAIAAKLVYDLAVSQGLGRELEL